jgi:hypothetical protein
MTCPTCGREAGACTHTTEGQVTVERPLSRGMAALLGKDPTRPQSAVSSSSPSSTAAAGGADMSPVYLYLGLDALKNALEALRNGYTTCAIGMIELAVKHLGKVQL